MNVLSLFQAIYSFILLFSLPCDSDRGWGEEATLNSAAETINQSRKIDIGGRLVRSGEWITSA